MFGSRKRAYHVGAKPRVTIDGTEINQGDFIVADSDGITVVPRHLFDEVVKECEKIALQDEKFEAAINQGHTLQQANKIVNHH